MHNNPIQPLLVTVINASLCCKRNQRTLLRNPDKMNEVIGFLASELWILASKLDIGSRCKGCISLKVMVDYDQEMAKTKVNSNNRERYSRTSK